MSSATAPFDPDLRGLAERFSNLAGQNAEDAIRLWKQETAALNEAFRSTASRLAEQQLSWLARAKLSRRPEGAALLTSWFASAYRRPALPQLPLLSSKATYAFCSSLIQQRATDPAARAEKRGSMVLLGLRRETCTLVNKGLGAYDDYIVVLNGSAGPRSARVFAATTEPSAQYAHRAQPLANGQPRDPRYKDVLFRKVEGDDVNKDGIKDAGRLKAGTYFYVERPGGYMKDRAFWTVGPQTAERDTNGDGRFNSEDSDRIDTKFVGNSMLIHKGGNILGGNTGSACCQTIPSTYYQSFLASLGRFNRFHYVLIDGV